MIVYIEELGAPKDMIDWYAGLAVSLSALSSALISPVWGRFADRYGRKPMMVRDFGSVLHAVRYHDGCCRGNLGSQCLHTLTGLRGSAGKA